MSYILDALKKSEQERKRGDVPDLKTVHASPASSADPDQRNWWPVIIGVALLVPVVVLLTIVIFEDRPGDPKVAGSSTSTSQPPGTSNSKSTSKSISRTQTSTGNSATISNSVEQKSQVKSKVVFSEQILEHDDTSSSSATAKSSARENSSNISKDAVPVTEVPESIRKQIPSISFAGHVYSSVSKRRSVMINGKKMREGDAVTSELILKEITPAGAEFTFRGYRFKLGALQDWSFQ